MYEENLAPYIGITYAKSHRFISPVKLGGNVYALALH